MGVVPDTANCSSSRLSFKPGQPALAVNFLLHCSQSPSNFIKNQVQRELLDGVAGCH